MKNLERFGQCSIIGGVVLMVVSFALPDAPAKVATPRDNRLAIESALQAGGVYTLPAGVTTVDQAPKLTTGCTLAGDPKAGSTLKSLQNAPALAGFAPGMGYASVSDISGPVQVGEWMFRFKFGQWDAKPRSILCRVTAVTGNGFITNPRGDPGDSFLRFRKAWPCGSPQEGQSGITLLVPSDGMTVGQWMYVTDGPSADAGRGEYRKVVAIDSTRITLDAPLKMSYGPAVLAWTEPLVGITVRDLRAESASSNQVANWVAAFKGTVNLKIERCDFGGMADVISSSGAVLSNLTGGAVQFNTSTDCRVQDSRVGSIYCEEESQDITVERCLIGHGRYLPQNCVTAFFRVRRLTFRDCRIVGAGSTTWPPPSAFNLHADDSQIVDCEVANSVGAWTYFGGDRLTIHRFRSDGGVDFTGGAGISAAHLRGAYYQFRDTTNKGNVILDAVNVRPGRTGWGESLVTDWKAPQQAAGAAHPWTVPPAEAKRPTLGDRMKAAKQ